MTEKKSKIISLSEKKKTIQDGMKELQEGWEDEEAQLTFDEIMAANEAKKKKLAEERKQANKSVLRSYRIKN